MANWYQNKPIVFRCGTLREMPISHSNAKLQGHVKSRYVGFAFTLAS